MVPIIVNILVFLLSITCFIYGFTTWNYRGPLLMNKYLLASDEEKDYLKHITEKEKREDYRYIAKISFGIGTMWLFYFLSFITNGLTSQIFFWIGNGVAAFLVFYVLKRLIR